MTITRTLLATAAVVVLGAGAAAAEGMTNTDGTHGTHNTQSNTEIDGRTMPQSYNAGEAPAETNARVDAHSDQTANSNNVTMDQETVQSVQASLRSEGHSVSVDGIWGPKTAAALRDFQRENSLPTTGALDAQTLAALNLDTNR